MNSTEKSLTGPGERQMTPREVRLQLNRIEDWMKENSDSFKTKEDLVNARAFIEVAHTELHLKSIQGYLREVVATS